MNRSINSDGILKIVVYTVLIVSALTMLYPFWNTIVISLNEGGDTAKGGLTLFPRVFTWTNYHYVIQDERLINAFCMTVIRTVLGTFLSVMFTAIFAYGISRKELALRNVYMKYCVITMYISGGLIPVYLLIKELHLLDSFWVYIIPQLFSVWNMIIFRSFFMNLSDGLIESAKIDGAEEYTIFFKVVLPLSTPVFATISLFTAVNHWNSWFDAAIYISNTKLLTLQPLLRQIINANTMDQLLAELGGTAAEKLAEAEVTSKSLSAATMLVATIPILVVYPFLQRYFESGIMLGSIKE